MVYNYDNLSWTEARELLKKWRDDNERKSEAVIELWENILEDKAHKLGNERFVVLEQVIEASLDCNRIKLAEHCIKQLSIQFPGSLRVLKYKAMKLEAQERYEEALDLLDSMIQRDETNSAPRKRRIAILKACGRIPEAIRELTEYLKKFMADQEGWHELCNLYLQEQDYAKAAFCMEELILHHPHNHLVHQRYADIRYTQGGHENIEIARQYYLQSLKLNAKNIRSLYGVFLTSNNIANSQKYPASKRKEAQKLMQWAVSKLQQQYKNVNDNCVGALENMMGSLQIEK